MKKGKKKRIEQSEEMNEGERIGEAMNRVCNHEVSRQPRRKN